MIAFRLFSVFQVCLLMSMLVLTACGSGDGNGGDGADDPQTMGNDTAIVLASSGLIVRAEPDKGAEKVASLSQYTRVRVIDKSGKEAEIDQMTAPWYRVMTPDGKKGWSFSGFLGFPGKAPHCTCPAAKTYVTYHEDVDGDPMRVVRGLRYNGKAKVPCFIDAAAAGLDHTSMGYTVSESGRWVAVDNGTDIFGTLSILDLNTGKIHTTFGYTRDLQNWEGESLTFWSSTGKMVEKPAGSEHPDWVEIEEVRFDNGVITKTGNTDKTETH